MIARFLQRAIEEGADFIETDILASKDGVLICHHDVFLDNTTNIADHKEFADRKRTYMVQGVNTTGFFVGNDAFPLNFLCFSLLLPLDMIVMMVGAFACPISLLSLKLHWTYYKLSWFKVSTNILKIFLIGCSWFHSGRTKNIEGEAEVQFPRSTIQWLAPLSVMYVFFFFNTPLAQFKIIFFISWKSPKLHFMLVNNFMVIPCHEWYVYFITDFTMKYILSSSRDYTKKILCTFQQYLTLC